MTTTLEEPAFDSKAIDAKAAIIKGRVYLIDLGLWGVPGSRRLTGDVQVAGQVLPSDLVSGVPIPLLPADWSKQFSNAKSTVAKFLRGFTPKWTAAGPGSEKIGNEVKLLLRKNFKPVRSEAWDNEIKPWFDNFIVDQWKPLVENFIEAWPAILSSRQGEIGEAVWQNFASGKRMPTQTSLRFDLMLVCVPLPLELSTRMCATIFQEVALAISNGVVARVAQEANKLKDKLSGDAERVSKGSFTEIREAIAQLKSWADLTDDAVMLQVKDLEKLLNDKQLVSDINSDLKHSSDLILGTLQNVLEPIGEIVNKPVWNGLREFDEFLAD